MVKDITQTLIGHSGIKWFITLIMIRKTHRYKFFQAMLNLKMARLLKDLCLLSEIEYDNNNELDFGMCTSFIIIHLDAMILESHLPRLIYFKLASCATSFGTVDVSALPPGLVTGKQKRYFSKHLKIHIQLM